MKHTLTTLAAIITAISAHASIYLAPTALLFDSSNSTFGYAHHRYGLLDGVVEYKRGSAYGLELGHNGKSWSQFVTASYQTIGIDGVTVGGMPKNWGDSVSGYSVGAGLRYKLDNGIFIGGHVGWQDMLGGGLYKQAEVGYKRGIFSLSVAKRLSDGATYDCIGMSDTRQTLVGLKITKNF